MKKHTEIYLKHFRLTVADFVPCEVCGRTAVDIHHIEARGMGGSEKDLIENLMAVCRTRHVEYGDKKQHMEFLKETHKNFTQNVETKQK